MNCTCYIYIFVVDKQSKQGPKVFSKIFILAMSIFKYWKDQNKKAEQNIRQKYFKIRHAYKKMELKETKTE